MAMRVSIVIPALNEEDSLGRVLEQIPFDRLPETEVIVVDNGSKDHTASVALSKGARVVFEPRKGYGIATRAGILEAHGDIIVTMDADGGHWPGDLPNVLRPFATGSSLAVLGVRIHSYPHGMRIRRFLGNVVLARIFNALYREHLSDVQCGFRAIHRKALGKLRLSQNGMQLTTELLIELREKGIPIWPVKVRQVATRRSHLRETRDFASHVTLMLKRFPSFRSARVKTPLVSR
jgi:glycosyltransferase involved in cell wall biosynthesis